MRGLDRWIEGREPEEPWQECSSCCRRDAETRMFLHGVRWLCDECAEAEDNDA